MEIKRKKITREEIFKSEQKFAKEISDICQYKDADFHTIGYELELEFGQKENEHQSKFDVFSDNEDKKYDSGYISRAMITVKRKKTKEEQMEELRLESENRALIDATEDTDPSDEEKEDKRSVAFTRVMLVRAYKSFWTEWISLTDDLTQLQTDLDEFFEVLSQKQDFAD